MEIKMEISEIKLLNESDKLMKGLISLKSYAFIVCIVTILAPSVRLYAQEGQVQATATVVISEIYFWPNESESEWVELKNISPNSVDISGWQITNSRDFTFIFPDTLPLMPTQGHALVKFDGQESALNDLLFDGDNLIVIHGPNEIVPADSNRPVGDVFGEDTDGECVLYTSGPKDTNTIKSFVTWGDHYSNTRSIIDAVKKGLWGQKKDTLYVSGHVYGSDGPYIKRGWSLGLYGNYNGTHKSHWQSYEPDEVTPGSENILPRPKYMGIDNSLLTEPMDIPLACRPVVGAVKYDIQIFKDKRCKNIVRDIQGFSGHRYIIPVEASLENGTYYWRMRAIDALGNVGEWSDVKTFSISFHIEK